MHIYLITALENLFHNVNKDMINNILENLLQEY